MQARNLEDLGPFHNRPAEWELYQPLQGCRSMLELGDKINAPHTYKAFFESRGFVHTSIDWNGRNGALSMDLRRPLDLGTFDIVTNIGTTEHVDMQEAVWRNLADACRIGSTLICTTPKPGQWQWHGRFHPHASFYRVFAALNGFNLERLYESGDDPRVMNFCRMQRLDLVPFRMPSDSHMHINYGVEC